MPRSSPDPGDLNMYISGASLCRRTARRILASDRKLTRKVRWCVMGLWGDGALDYIVAVVSSPLLVKSCYRNPNAWRSSGASKNNTELPLENGVRVASLLEFLLENKWDKLGGKENRLELVRI